MRDDLKDELLRVQEQALGDAIEDADLAHEQDTFDRDGRGDRVWYLKSANQSLTIACQIERLLAAKSERKGHAAEASEERAVRNMVSKAEAAASARLERLRGQ